MQNTILRSFLKRLSEDGIPAIVPKELFERAQEQLAKSKKAPARHNAAGDYLLTTKLYCEKCGSFMVRESYTSHTMKVHRYYCCVNTKKKKLCDKKAVKKDWIEDLVVNYTMKAIMNDEVMGRLIDTLMELQKKESTGIPYLWVSGVFMKKADKKRGKIFMPRSVYILFRFSQTKYVKYMPKLHTLSIYLNLWRI